MKNELKKSLKIAALFISFGLLISLFVFFLLFGKGLQILLPLIFFCIFFAVFFLFEKLPFIKRHTVLKIIAALILIAAFIVIL